MRNTLIRRTAALVSVATLAFLASPGLQAQQVPIPTTAAKVSGPPPGTNLTTDYVQTVARAVYVWGWALVNRHAAFSNAILRHYGPTEAAIDKTGKPGDIVKTKRRGRTFTGEVYKLTVKLVSLNAAEEELLRQKARETINKAR